MFLHCRAVAIAAAITVALPQLAYAVAPSVRVDDAVLHGIASNDGRIAAFLGIPFAKPPFGDGRWRAPEAIQLKGSLDASTFAPACMQSNYMVDWYHDLMRRFGADPASFPVPAFSEDCLYLNIWSPAVEPSVPLPVMVWIHGGGNRGGWAYEPNYTGDELAKQGVVVVSIAYRLDIFGFYSHPDLETSNFGLLDQVAALEWVHEHIESFGGDPANVTVFGESAGAASIAYLMASPLAEGLFRRAIHQSAGYEAVTFDTREEFLDEGLKVQNMALEMSADEHRENSIDALRKVPAATMLDAAKAVFTDYRPDVVVDGTVVSRSFANSMAAGQLAPVDLLIGTNADEWRMYLDDEDPARQLNDTLAELAANDAAKVKAQLGTETPELQRLDRLITAEQFVCPSLQLADAVTQAGGASYVYYFDRVRDGRAAQRIGAYHGAELPYVFDQHDAWLPTAGADRRLTRRMMQLWTSFARTGKPVADDTVPWPTHEAAGDQTMVLGNGARLIEHPERRLCEALSPDAQSAAP